MRWSRHSLRHISPLLLTAAMAVTTSAAAAAEGSGAVNVPAASGEGPAAPAPARLLTAEEIEDLVAPVALYPDDLLAIVLPASTFPLQVVQAARFLEAAREDSSLKPDEDWDDSVVALLNYPEVLEKLSDDLDWTWELGQAVLAQQEDVVARVASFRDRAHTAGNLKSDDRQIVEVADSTIYIKPANPEVIYVPYYEPSRVVVYQRAPVYYYYYPRAYPVYYYPYPVGYQFYSGFFWGVTTYYSLGWHTRHVHIHPYDHRWHPYYDRWSHYDFGHYYYRRPRTVVHNHYYFPANAGRYHAGNAWRPYDRRYDDGRPGRPHYRADHDRHRDGDGRRFDDRYRDGNRYRDSNRYRDGGRFREGERRWAGTNVDGDHRGDHASRSAPIDGRARLRQPDQVRPDGPPRKSPPAYRAPEQRNSESRVAWAERSARGQQVAPGQRSEPAQRTEPSRRASIIRQEPENRGRWAAAAAEQHAAQAPRPQLRSFAADRGPAAAAATAPQPRRSERSEPRGYGMREQGSPQGGPRGGQRGEPSPPRHGRDGDRASFIPR